MKKYLLVIFLILVIHVILLINLRFTAWPEMLSYAFLRNNGFLLYKDMVHPYPPVLTMTLSIIYKLFGYKLMVLKAVTWLIILANDILVFLIVKKSTRRSLWAVVGLLFYVSAQPFLEGNQLWFDLAIVPAILFGTYFMLDFLGQPSRKASAVAAGFAFGVAALTKQTAGLFLIVNGLWLMVKYRDVRKLLIFLTGPVILFLILGLRLISEGALKGFFNWTLIYPLKYWSHSPGYVQMALTRPQLLILILLSFPALYLFWRRKYSLITFYFLLSLVLVYPRFSFFHFQLGIAFAAILFTILLSSLKSKRFVYVLCTIYSVLAIVLARQTVAKDWQKEARFWGGGDIKAAELIKNSTKPDGLIYLLGPQSGLYVLSDRVPPKPWVDNFSWYWEIPSFQEEVILRWGQNKPQVVFTSAPQPGNWYDLGTYRPQKITDWIDKEKIDENSLP